MLGFLVVSRGTPRLTLSSPALPHFIPSVTRRVVGVGIGGGQTGVDPGIGGDPVGVKRVKVGLWSAGPSMGWPEWPCGLPDGVYPPGTASRNRRTAEALPSNGPRYRRIEDGAGESRLLASTRPESSPPQYPQDLPRGGYESGMVGVHLGLMGAEPRVWLV